MPHGISLCCIASPPANILSIQGFFGLKEGNPNEWIQVVFGMKQWKPQEKIWKINQDICGFHSKLPYSFAIYSKVSEKEENLPILQKNREYDSRLVELEWLEQAFPLIT
ncbi:hypothetical protein AMTRI_Chr03g144120 [Amborella trichopoda]